MLSSKKRKLQPASPPDLDVEPLELTPSKLSVIVDESLSQTSKKLCLNNSKPESCGQASQDPSKTPSSPRASRLEENMAKSNQKI